MREYELTIVFDLAVAEAGGPDASVEKLTNYVEARGGKVLKVDHWGRRRLAYPIGRAMDADYVVSRVELEPANISPLEAALRIDERVYRHLVVRADELPAPPPPREPRQAPAAVATGPAPEAAAAPAEAPAAAAETAEAPESAAPAEAPAAAAETAEAPESEAPAEAPAVAAETAEAPAATPPAASEEAAPAAAPEVVESAPAPAAEAEAPAEAAASEEPAGEADAGADSTSA